MRTTLFLVPAVALAAGLALTGCSSSSSSAGSTPSASSSTAASPKCVDGAMTVTGTAHSKINVTSACDTITVEATGAIVSLPATKSVDITGSKNTVTVDSATAITATGSDNVVFYGAAAKPKVTDSGSGNTIGQR